MTQISKNFDRIDFLGIKLSVIDKVKIVSKIIEFADSEETKFMTYLNAHCLNISFVDKEYKDILKKADLVYAGGQGVVWATKLLGNPLPERANILDFFEALAKKLDENKVSLYLLGNSETVVRKTAERLKNYYNLQVLGFHHGFFNKTEEENIIEEINRLRPKILIVGMGVPRQEKWANANLDQLEVGLCWTLGAAFSFLSGCQKKAPRWMINMGLEWLFRLIQEPKRLWKRYIIGNFIFIYHVLCWKIKQVFMK